LATKREREKRKKEFQDYFSVLPYLSKTKDRFELEKCVAV
jgi:hypothetical protein